MSKNICQYYTNQRATQAFDLPPYHLVFGREMNPPYDTSLIPRNDLNKDAKSHVSDLMSHLKIVKDIAKENKRKAQIKQKHQYDKKATELPEFRVGQSVLLHTTKVPVHPILTILGMVLFTLQQ